jgi:hypothetical protein
MQCIVNKELLSVWFVPLDLSDDFYSPFDDQPFVCVLLCHVAEVSDVDRARLCQQIVSSSCQYVICAGVDCSIWDETLDWAFTDMQTEDGDNQDQTLLTTWHEDEPLLDVFRFAFESDAVVPVASARYVVLSLAEQDNAMIVNSLIAFLRGHGVVV